jgi:GNAT superfamily N-acetyltransferase
MAQQFSGDELPVKHKTRVHDPRDPAWFETQGAMSGYNAHTLGVLKTILDATTCENCGVLAFDDEGNPAAAVLATVANGIGVYLNVVADPAKRGKGFGRAAMSAALNWSREAGATSAAIQVLADNTPAVSLYTSLGFSQVYDYHYRKPAE